MDILNLTLKIWRQDGPDEFGEFKSYDINGVNSHMSFLEMLDVLNEQLLNSGDDPIVFDDDCREGICGMCSMVINGRPHGLLHGLSLIHI